MGHEGGPEEGVASLACMDFDKPDRSPLGDGSIDVIKVALVGVDFDALLDCLSLGQAYVRDFRIGVGAPGNIEC